MPKNRDQVVVHKTFHRYVVRAKRGTVQSQHDNTGKYAKSAGACIRRSQEAAFKDVRKYFSLYLIGLLRLWGNLRRIS